MKPASRDVNCRCPCPLSEANRFHQLSEHMQGTKDTSVMPNEKNTFRRNAPANKGEASIVDLLKQGAAKEADAKKKKASKKVSKKKHASSKSASSGMKKKASKSTSKSRKKAAAARRVEDYTDSSRGIRLQKAMAEAGVASRRDCEDLITQGRVVVNGEKITTLPAWVDPNKDRIEVFGEAINTPKLKATKARKFYVMVNKPKGVISTNDDPEGRRRVIDLVNIPGNPRLYPVGRLDADSTGLILLTNDGDIANKLTHPRYEVVKHYQVKIKGRLTEEDAQRMKKGLFLANTSATSKNAPKSKKASALQVKILGIERDRFRGDRTTIAITLKEGQNREIRRLLAQLGYNVRKLKRVGIGPLRLKGVTAGSFRFLTAPEIAALKKATRSKK
ncbi:rRNA pseudouridine synthase [Planctomycetota bacterium]|nr:rRNA pseudouridine synthase [Planctomycetota bacterium]